MDFNYKTEAEIQFELGQAILDAGQGLSVYFERNFEVPNFGESTKRGKPRKIRADIVVCRGTEVLCLVEVKNHKKPSKKSTRQTQKYENLPFPTYWCWNENFITSVLDTILVNHG